MSLFVYTYGWLFRVLFPKMLWKVKTNEKHIYLTFDDGPLPNITPFILEELRKWNAQATFFCVGDNITKHPDIFDQIIAQGHTVGNHTFHHKKGTKTSNHEYYHDIDACQKLITTTNDRLLFRPPYGKLKFRQLHKISKKYSIVMWHILAGDFLPRMTVQKCLKILIRNTKKGSIIVLHDNQKTFHIVKEVLPHYLAYFTQKGYQFKKLI